MTIPEDIRKACMTAGFKPDSAEGMYVIGATLQAEGMKRFREDIEKKRTAEHGDEILTVASICDEYEVSRSWVRDRINRKENPLPCVINDGVQRIRRSNLESWAKNDPKDEQKINNKPIIEFPTNKQLGQRRKY